MKVLDAADKAVATLLPAAEDMAQAGTISLTAAADPVRDAAMSNLAVTTTAAEDTAQPAADTAAAAKTGAGAENIGLVKESG